MSRIRYVVKTGLPMCLRHKNRRDAGEFQDAPDTGLDNTGGDDGYGI